MAPEGNGPSSQDPESDPGNPPDPEKVASRADGRPPEEATSDNPKAQAQAILEESEDRIAAGTPTSDSIDEPFSQPSEDQLEEDGAD